MPPYPVFGPEEHEAVRAVLEQGTLSTWSREGPVADMEDALAATFGAAYALSFSSGTASIHAALWAVGVRPGTLVLTPSYTWLSAITAIYQAGATPVFCDVAPGSVNLDPREISRRATPDVSAVMATHMWGMPAPMTDIVAESAALGLPVVEDCSHAHGATIGGRSVGTLGDVGCFSLQNTKPIVAGEGGFLLTDRHDVYCASMVLGHNGPRLRQELLRTDVEVDPDLVARLTPVIDASPSYKYRIPVLSAAIAAQQIPKLEPMNSIRAANYAVLRNSLSARADEHLTWLEPGPADQRGWYAVPALLDGLDGVDHATFIDACRAEGVSLRDDYPDWSLTPLLSRRDVVDQFWMTAGDHPVPGGERGRLPNTEALQAHLLLFQVPSVPSVALMEQTASAVDKVLAGLPDLRRTAAAS